MNHHASPAFWALLDALPERVRALAKKNFELLKRDPRHPSLHFKPVGRFRSVRVGAHYRALAVEVPIVVSGSGSDRTGNTIGWLANAGWSWRGRR